MQSNIRIVDIARMANVSAGTVDRVLHNRGQVSAEKREKVERVLREINYQPNMVARFLASNKSYSIKALTPQFHEGEYWELVSKGINQAIEELSDFKILVDYSFYNQDDESSFIKIAEDIKQDKFDALIVPAHFKDATLSLSSHLDSLSIPYVYIDTEVAEQNNLAYFGANTYLSGSIAAKLMLLEIGLDGDIVMVNTKSDKGISYQQGSRRDGFLDYLEQKNFKGSLDYYDFDISQVQENVSSFKCLIDSKKSRVGVVVFNSRVHELIRLNDLCKADIKIIGYDPIEKNVKALKEDKISYLISQHPNVQGYTAIKSLGDYLVFGKTPNKDNYMPIDILIKENVDFHDNRI